MNMINKMISSFLTALIFFLGALNVNGETLETVFESFNKNAERAADILSKREASNESLSYLRADLFEDRNQALLLQRKINNIYLVQMDELKLIDDLIAESSIKGTYIVLERQN